MMDLQQFYYHRCPTKVMTEKHFLYNMALDKDVTWAPRENFTYQDYINASSEHDAIHYLLDLSFGEEDERKVVYVEEHCKVGWVPYGDKFNSFIKKKIIFNLPKEFGRLKILETAEQLRELY